MNRWTCEFKECPLRGIKGICGDGSNEPVIVSYHPVGEGNKECYVRHVTLCWNEWKRISNRYMPSIRRILESVLHISVDLKFLWELCSIAILYHDVGKLCENYQSRSRNFYRHEMVSSFLIHNYVKGMLSDRSSLDEHEIELFSSIISAAVYLHHEGLQISHEYYEMRAPTYGYLLNLLAGREFRMINKWRFVSSEIEKFVFGKELNYFEDVNLISGYDVANTLGSIITIIDGWLEPLSLRLAVASILQPIMISDNLASMKRGGKPSRLSMFLGVMER